ncbi:MAG: adenylosuccinate lyase [Anaerolineae bacterium]|jgi:adenylosuccinate lyase
MDAFTHETFLSPFSWRYGSAEMRNIWSQFHQRRLWRRVWVALASVQAEAGLVSEAQVEDLRAHQDAIDWERAQELERALRHDLMAEVRTYAEQCAVGGGIIHLGATSMDIEDNAEALRIREALALVRAGIAKLLRALMVHIQAEADTVVMAYTHIQPAEPTTVGYRLAQYAYEFLCDLQSLDAFVVRGKGFKGAVGTAASYAHLLAGTDMTPEEMERRVMERLGLEAMPVTTQTYSRKMDYGVLAILAGIAASAHKLALDMRLLQSPLFGEMSEPFGRQQVGSSAMPFKRNPINAESVCSLARYVASLPQVTWSNAALSMLERTLDDSANRRTVLPEAFLAVDEILSRLTRIVTGLTIGRPAIARNLAVYGPFSATEPLLMALVKAGADRQAMHEVIRDASMTAWAAIQTGSQNPLVDLLTTRPDVLRWLSPETVRSIMAQGADAGQAPAMSRALCTRIEAYLEQAPQHTQR